MRWLRQHVSKTAHVDVLTLGERNTAENSQVRTDNMTQVNLIRRGIRGTRRTRQEFKMKQEMLDKKDQ